MRLKRRRLLATGASAVGLAMTTSLACVPPPLPPPNRTWLTARTLGTRDAPRTEADALTSEYESRWYKLTGLKPGDDVTVTLRMPPRAEVDYTLLGFTDIAKIAQKFIDKLAPANGTLDADDMDSDDMDSDDMDSDDMDSDDMDSDDMDSDDMDSDDMDSDDMDSDDMDSGDPGTYRAVYGRAQRHALRSASVTTGPADEQIHMIAGADGDTLYFRVRGHLGAFDPETRFTIQASVTPDRSCDRAPTDTPQSELAGRLDLKRETLILTNSDRASLGLTDEGQRRAFRAKLDELAAAVDGVVYDVHDDPPLRKLYDNWGKSIEAPPAPGPLERCVPLANTIVEAIRAVVARSSAKYIVIAGGDDVIPFARIEDRAEISREWAWNGPYNAEHPLGATLTHGLYLSDDPYGTTGPLDVRGRSVRAPSRAVGRLVESGTDIGAHIDWYLRGDVAANVDAGKAGIVVRDALVAGYTFVADLANNLHATLLNGGVSVDRLPDDTWTAQQLSARLLRPILPGSLFQGHQLIAVQGHYSANTILPPKLVPEPERRRFRTNDPAVAGKRLAGKVWMTIGCHSGHDIVDPQARTIVDAQSGRTLAYYDREKRFSWAEVLVRQGATLVGGTGYQYAESELPENSERLYHYLAQEIVAPGPRAIGHALIAAKQRYLAERLQVRGIDQKLIEVSTIYGLPMLKVGVLSPQDAPRARLLAPDKPESPKGDVLRAPVRISGYTFPERPTVVMEKGSYWPVGESLIVRSLRPVLPGVFRDISQSAWPPSPEVTGTNWHPVGVIWTSGTFDEVDQGRPLISEPVTEARFPRTLTPPTRTPKYQNRAFLPARPFRIARSGGGKHSLAFAPMQFNAQQGKARRWKDASFTISYARARDVTALYDAPKIQKPTVFAAGTSPTQELRVSITVRHYASESEPIEAYASYLDATKGTLATVPLTGGSSAAVGATWKREFTGGLGAAPIDSLVFFQAMGGNGRVSALTNAGRLFPSVSGGTRQTKIEFTNVVPAAPLYRDRITVKARLSYVDNTPAADKDVLFRLGGARMWKRTASDGTAEVQLTVAVRPRDSTYLVVASFPGDGDARPSAISRPVKVARAKTNLTPPRDSKMTAKPTERIEVGVLTGTTRNRPLGDRPIWLRRKAASGDLLYVVYTEPDNGRLWLEAADVGLTTGTAELTVEFEGDARYEGAPARAFTLTTS